MNAFESLVAALIGREGYWVIPGFKVLLSKEQKREVGRPSTPRWEIDLAAYKPASNHLLFIECKSYLDSPGVRARDLEPGGKNAGRYKLFTEPELRTVVLETAAQQLVKRGLCLPEPRHQLCLAAGRIATEKDRVLLSERFTQNGWLLRDEQWLKSGLRALALDGYENSVASLVAKLLPEDE